MGADVDDAVRNIGAPRFPSKIMCCSAHVTLISLVLIYPLR